MTHPLKRDAVRRQGFTLIELAIVLVIIGLIIGGVLVGQDMIKAAQIRSEITQITQLNTAVGAFRLKYECLPGDCGSSVTAGGITGVGDSNNLVTCYPSTAYAGTNADLTPVIGTGEVVNAIAEIGGAGLFAFAGSATVSDTPVVNNFPKSRISNAGIIPYGINGYNYWALALNPSFPLSTAVGVMTAASGGNNPWVATISPYQGSQIDGKMDDALPMTGTVQARAATTTSTGIYAAAAAASCYTGTTVTSAYANLGTATENLAACELIFRWHL